MIPLLQAAGYKVLTTDIEGGMGVVAVWDLQRSPPTELHGSVNLFISCSELEYIPGVNIAYKNIMAATNFCEKCIYLLLRNGAMLLLRIQLSLSCKFFESIISI